jgi:hypothetical protein
MGRPKFSKTLNSLTFDQSGSSEGLNLPLTSSFGF